ncbi:hypothetical protein WICPIJ_004498 [Wickerhamomyces pijperi]|uniref:DMAP1-binding domain-containing protein n=1 Tax=Wickerhamomyces pijperi TaxID=599730 RepID=A0A9P8Q590_WICPI|nr:hypothetical protein WICPIJ_004498 [Wickerhamomyces pijperi]
MDNTSIPSSSTTSHTSATNQALKNLDQEFADGLLTEKGYQKKKALILSDFSELQGNHSSSSLLNSSLISRTPSSTTHNHPIASQHQHVKNQSIDAGSIASGLTNSNNSYLQHMSHKYNQSISSTPNSLHQTNSGHNQHIRNYSVATTNSSLNQYQLQQESIQNPDLYYLHSNNNDPSFLPSFQDQELQKPLEPRKLPKSTPFSTINSLASILRSRGCSATYGHETSFSIVDSKGKQTTSISWEKLYLKAEKIAQMIRDKSGMYTGDRVCLIYQDVETIEFAIALFGCFLAGVVAVPLALSWNMKEIIGVMTTSQAGLCLTTEAVFKYLEKKVADSVHAASSGGASAYKWPKGMDFWKTNVLGSFHQSRKDKKNSQRPVLQLSDLAYIEFSKSPDGTLNGVCVSHKTLMNQMRTLTAVISSNPNFNGASFERPIDNKGKTPTVRQRRNVMLNILDTRKSVGLICGILLNVYSGNVMVWTPASILNTAGLYAHIVTKYQISILLNDYLNLKQVVYNYQSFPQYTRKFSSKYPVDFSLVKMVLIHTLIVDGEFHEILTNRWLKPLGCKNVKDVVSPLLTLTEFGGMVISMRDWIGGEEKLNTKMISMDVDEYDSISDLTAANIPSSSPTADSSSVAISELLIDKQSLTSNTVQILSDTPTPSQLETLTRSSQYLRIGSFGFPLPDATLAIVNPETRYLSQSMQVGEIWIHSVSLPSSFWNSDDNSREIFKAKCMDYEGELDLEFLRTGLLGFTYNGKVYVLGLYEDRFRQRVITSSSTGESDYSYHYLDHIAYTLTRHIPQRRISDAAAFDTLINNEYLPVILLESPLAIPNEVTGAVDITELDNLASKALAVLTKFHDIRPYCVLIVRPEALPRTMKSGIPGVANFLCKRLFQEGSIRSVYVKFNVNSGGIREIPRSRYYLDSIWSEYVSRARSQSLRDVAELQMSGLDLRDVSVDSRSGSALTGFNSILEIFKWRVKNQPDELAIATVIGKQGTSTRGLSWRKFELKVISVINLLIDQIRKRKLLIKVGSASSTVIGLMFTLSDDYIASLYACLLMGFSVVPLNAIDRNRAFEDIPSLVSIVKDFSIQMILVNGDVESLVKNKPISNYLKQSSVLASVKFKSVSKLSAPSSSSKLTVTNMEPTIKKTTGSSASSNNSSSVVLINFSEDNKRTGVHYNLQTLTQLCKILKETCQLQPHSPHLACVRHTNGLGFLQSGIVGVYLGAATYILPPVEFALNPSLFYQVVQRYKIKDVYITTQMVSHSIKNVRVRSTSVSSHTSTTASVDLRLDKLQNMLIPFESSRPAINLMNHFLYKFSQSAKLAPTAVSYAYTHQLSPIVTLRSYLSFEPVDLYVDTEALRLGLISVVDPTRFNSFNVIRLQDSGIVPVCTQVVIVNPETREVCKVGEYGEIWVCSEGNSQGIVNNLKELRAQQNPNFIQKQFQYGAMLANSDNQLQYIRTGDLGFLHTITSTANLIDYQSLFVLGPLANTIESLGLMHFVTDIEATIESCHRDIKANGSVIFKADGFNICVIDTTRVKYLSSLVPVVFNEVLRRHRLVLDVVAFTESNGIPYSRLGDKQRSKLINMWNDRKLKLRVKYGSGQGEIALIETVRKFEEEEDQQNQK